MFAADAAFDAAPWHDFALMAGGAAAALTGLVFVAVSLQLQNLSRDPSLRHRAASSLVFLFTIVAASAAILAPQSARAVGAEFLGLVIVGAAAGRKALRSTAWPRDQLSRVLTVIQRPTAILGIIGDLSLYSSADTASTSPPPA